MTIKYKVAVHKNLPLKAGETLREFTQKLRLAGDEFLKRQLNINKGAGGTFMVEVMSNVAVFEVFKRDDSGPLRFFALKFARNKEDKFELSDTTEVERVTSFRAKSATIQKRLVAESTGDDAWCRKSRSLFAGVI